MPVNDESPWVVFHYARGVWPPRRSSQVDLKCWGRHAKAPVVYLNVAFGLELDALAALAPSRIIFDTTFMKLRWREPDLMNDPSLIDTLSKMKAAKILRPQDEFVNTDAIDDFACAIRADVILSCAPPHEHDRIYPEAKAHNIHVKQVMTAYVDEDLRRRFINKSTPLSKRSIDVGYRAWRATPWLGRHAKLKVDIAEKALETDSAKSLNLAISLDPSDVAVGDDWLKFLQNCKAVIGVEGGASIHDADGQLREHGMAFLNANGPSDFATVEAACFAGKDGSFDLRCLSPRHLEAAAVGTAQFLVEGEYNGALIAGEHYIPLSHDLSNVDAAFRAFDDLEALQTMADRARNHVLTTASLGYPAFVSQVATWSKKDHEDTTVGAVTAKPLIAKLQRRDRFLLKRVQFEVWLGQRPKLRSLLSNVRKLLSSRLRNTKTL